MSRILACGIALSLVLGVPAGAEPLAEAGASARPAAAEGDRVTVRTGRALDFEGKPV